MNPRGNQGYKLAAKAVRQFEIGLITGKELSRELAEASILIEVEYGLIALNDYAQPLDRT